MTKAHTTPGKWHRPFLTVWLALDFRFVFCASTLKYWVRGSGRKNGGRNLETLCIGVVSAKCSSEDLVGRRLQVSRRYSCLVDECYALNLSPVRVDFGANLLALHKYQPRQYWSKDGVQQYTALREIFWRHVRCVLGGLFSQRLFVLFFFQRAWGSISRCMARSTNAWLCATQLRNAAGKFGTIFVVCFFFYYDSKRHFITRCKGDERVFYLGRRNVGTALRDVNISITSFTVLDCSLLPSFPVKFPVI